MTQTNKPYKKLYRSRDERVIAGVCGGLAQYFEGIDPVIIRLIFIILFFLGGATFWAYVIMWFVVPLESE